MDMQNSIVNEKKGSDGNVVSLFGEGKPEVQKASDAAPEELIKDKKSSTSDDVYAIFCEAIKRNRDNRNRQQSDRGKSNKNVLRSYRIKD